VVEDEGEDEGDGEDVEATLRRNTSSAAVDERARATRGGGGRRRFAVVAVLAVAVLCRKRCSSIFACAFCLRYSRWTTRTRLLGILRTGLRVCA